MYCILRLAIRLLGKLKTSGEHNVPGSGGVLYCPNHLSDADPPTLFVSLPRRAWYVGKSELFEIPVVGAFFRSFRGFPIKRDSADRAALRKAERLLMRGEPLVLFPEGRCAQDGVLARLQPGAALLAIRTNCPIVPVGIAGTNRLLPYGSRLPRFTHQPVTVMFGPPIYPSEFSHLANSRAIEAITEKLGERIAGMTNQIPPPFHRKIRRSVPLADADAQE